MTSWITPKTNWKNGDYYQQEDAERFINNLIYLKNLAEPSYPSGAFYFMNYVAEREYVAEGDYDEITHYDYYLKYDLNFSSMSIPTLNNNLLYIFSVSSETLFKLGLLKNYYVDYQKKYPLNYGTVYHDQIYIPPRDEYTTTGWYISDFAEGIDHTALRRAWYDIFNDGYGSMAIPFDFAINTNYSWYSTNYYKWGNNSFFSAAVLNILESVMSDLYPFFNEIAEIYPREDVEE